MKICIRQEYIQHEIDNIHISERVCIAIIFQYCVLIKKKNK